MSKLKLGFISKTLQSLYSDSFSTKRKGTIFDEKTKQTRNNTKDEQPVKDKECRVSFKDYDSPDTGNDAINEEIYNITVFCDVSLDVKKGDTITAKRLADDNTTVLQLIEGVVGEPKHYPSHQEIPVLIDEKG